MIRLVGVEKSFDGQKVLNGATLEIPKGQITTIIGKSGEGKSVLLKHMIGLLRPDRGQVLVEGVDIATMRSKELNQIRKKFGMLFQGAALFDSLTVFENVAFPLREKTKLTEEEISAIVLKRLAEVGLNGMGHKYPAEISGGMKKRVGLARALVLEPEIILFDEPTTGLDPLTKTTIHNLIDETQRRFGFTAVVVSHEIPDIFKITHQVIMLQDGVVIEAGTPEEIQHTQNNLVREFITGTVNEKNQR